jgi:hypothetical protein
MKIRSAASVEIFLFALLVLNRLARAGQAPANAGQNKANEMPSVTIVPEAARSSDHFDADAATDA